MLTPSNSAFFPLSAPGQKGSRLPWYVTLIGCVYYGWLGLGFQKVIPIFAKLFDGLGVELPLPTRFLLCNYLWFLPGLYLAAIFLTILNQFAFFDQRQQRFANWYLLFAGAVLPSLLALTLYLPLFVLIHKLQGGR